MKAKDCMCNDVCCVTPNTNIQEVAQLMNKYHVGCIPVCDENNAICGIITDRDILLRCVACDKNTKQTPVSEIMTCNVWTCKQDEDMTNVETKMSQNQIRRLPVCDNNNHVVGILTLADLTQNGTTLGKEAVFTTIENICNCNGQEKNAE